MESTPYKTEKVYNGKIEYRRIQAWQAREFDGELSNWERGTPSGDRWLIEKQFIPNDRSQSVRFTNCW